MWFSVIGRELQVPRDRRHEAQRLVRPDPVVELAEGADVRVELEHGEFGGIAFNLALGLLAAVVAWGRIDALRL